MNRERALLLALRVGLPVALAIAGVVLFIVGGGRNSTAAAGVVLIGVGLLVWMINWMYRMTISSNDDREAEERRREYFTQHGHWPGEGEGDS
jgi:hypothetical protein